jgi:hypothetical protein
VRAGVAGTFSSTPPTTWQSSRHASNLTFRCIPLAEGPGRCPTCCRSPDNNRTHEREPRFQPYLHPHQQQCITIPKCQNICILPARAPKCMQIVPSLPHFQNDQPTTAQTATPSLPEAVCLTFAHLATRKATDGDNHGVARRTTQVTAGFVLALAAFANRIRGPMALPLLSMPSVCPYTICGL